MYVRLSDFKICFMQPEDSKNGKKRPSGEFEFDNPVLHPIKVSLKNATARITVWGSLCWVPLDRKPQKSNKRDVIFKIHFIKMYLLSQFLSDRFKLLNIPIKRPGWLIFYKSKISRHLVFWIKISRCGFSWELFSNTQSDIKEVNSSQGKDIS